MAKPPMPTDAELEILGLLWELGPSTVRRVHDVLQTRRDIGYTAVLKLMQIMADKGLVDRDKSQRSHVYSSRKSAATTQRRVLRDLMERAFGGSSQRLVMQALATKRITSEELRELRELLDKIERD